MANQRRLERINSLMKRIISEEVVFRLRDPRIGFVTITRVSVTPDLSDAKVYFSVLGDEEEVRTTTRGLRSASGPIRSVVAREMQIRSVPRLEFVYDPSLREQAELDRILKQDRLKQGRMLEGADAEEEEEEEEEEEDPEAEAESEAVADGAEAEQAEAAVEAGDEDDDGADERES